jgi:hypothetical protein
MLHAVAILAALVPVLLQAGQAHAYMLYPDSDNPRNLIVVIERATGDLVSFASLPPPFNVARQTAQAPERFSFRWRYARRQEGIAWLNVDGRGRGVLAIEFSNAAMVDGDSFGVAAVLVGKDERPLHTFYARADVRGATFEGGTERKRVRLVLERPPDWWDDVGAISFHYMKYAKHQELDDAEMWEAMRSVVGIFTKGEGTEQRR